jgi:hypothetical protein
MAAADRNFRCPRFVPCIGCIVLPTAKVGTGSGDVGKAQRNLNLEAIRTIT